MSEAKTEHKGVRSPVALVVLIVIIAAGLCGLLWIVRILTGDAGGTSRPSSSARPATYSVVYIVEGFPYEADVTYTNKTGNTEQATISLPWRYAFQAERGQFLYVSAQTSGSGDAARIECQITVNGTVAEEARSTGAYKIASCSGSVD
jgi:hypothetical protein